MGPESPRLLCGPASPARRSPPRHTPRREGGLRRAWVELNLSYFGAFFFPLNINRKKKKKESLTESQVLLLFKDSPLCHVLKQDVSCVIQHGNQSFYSAKNRLAE